MAGLTPGCCVAGCCEEEDDSVSRVAVEVFAKLKDLKCPFLQGLYITEPKTILELLCSPSKYRLEILEWMFIRVCPSWHGKFGSWNGVSGEVKIQEMVKLGHELMLCGLDDQELLKGWACAQKQLHFMDQLLDVVGSLTISYTGCSSVQQHFKDTKEKNEALLRDLFSGSNLQALLSPKGDFWSMDWEFLDKKSSNCQRMKSCAELAEEEEKVVELARQLQASAAKVMALQTEFSWCAEDEVARRSCFPTPPPDAGKEPGAPGAGRAASRDPLSLALQHFVQYKPGSTVSRAHISTLDQKLRLVVSDFHQLVMVFLQVYDDELSECCKRPNPYLHPCGPIVQDVYQTLTSCNQMLKVVAEITDSSTKAVEIVKQQQNEKICWSNNHSVMSLATKMEELIQRYKLFKDCLRIAPK